LNSKGLGADTVFLIGFDQGKFPSEIEPTDNETYQMLVAVTRGKKKLYLTNNIGKPVSSFIKCSDTGDLKAEEIKSKPSKPARKSLSKSGSA